MQKLLRLLIRDKLLLVVSGATFASGLRNTLSLWVRLPEALLSAGEPLHPWGKEAALETPSPGLLLILVGWYDATGRRLLNDPYDGVDEHVRANTGDQTVGDRVCERHDRNGEESGNGIAQVAPVDVLGRCCHERSNDDQCAASSPGRNRCENRSEEDGDEEAETREHGSKTSLASFGDTGTRLDVCGDWRASHERSDTDTKSVD